MLPHNFTAETQTQIAEIHYLQPPPTQCKPPHTLAGILKPVNFYATQGILLIEIHYNDTTG